MEQKDRYTLRELFNNLEITMTELKKRSGISDVTLASVRSGQSARLRTINILLRIFSEIYGLKFSLDNVDGIIIQGKPVDAIIHPIEKPSTPSLNNEIVNYVPPVEVSQNRIEERNTGRQAPTNIPDDLPHGTVKLIDFIEEHGLLQGSMSRWMKAGIRGEKIETTKIDRYNGPGVQHFLTPEQQSQALDFLKRHGKLKTSQPKQVEKPWYERDGE